MYQSPNAPTTVNVEDPIAVMQRFELKYILNREQMAYLQRRLEGHMQPDQFGRTSIASLYYDTPDMRLIRTSLEGLPFKEKLRLRSYGLATETSPVFLELKRKAHGVVYKRRVQTTVPRAEGFFRRENQPGAGGQIDRELTYFRDHYENLAPSCLIIYDRTAYFTPGGDLRLTIDENPRYRTEQLELTRSMEGVSLLPEQGAVLEIKVQGAMPLWLAEALSEGRIYKTSFSKYGAAYRHQITKMRTERNAVLCLTPSLSIPSPRPCFS